MVNSYTNSALSTARNCLMRFEFAYELQLENTGSDPVNLQVGDAWHQMQEARELGQDPFAVLAKHPFIAKQEDHLWYHKLARLFAGHQWYWGEQDAGEAGLWEPEFTWEKQLPNGVTLRGQIDGRSINRPDGRRGIREYKTTSLDLSPGSDYWDRLGMDTQTGLYGLAEDCPDFILYDVVKKPTIKPKKLVKAQLKQIGETLDSGEPFEYHGESFAMGDDLGHAFDTGVETPALYAARLAEDIGSRPQYYFARREVSRTEADYKALIEQTTKQIELIEAAQGHGLMHRNPDACQTIQKGTCPFIRLCQSNCTPDDVRRDGAPEGFRIREHLHPELVSG